MSTDFLLPDLGEGLPEAELIQWHVAVGDTVTLNQPIAEVETAKAVVDLPSPYAGVVNSLHAEAGSTVEVGAVLITFDLDGDEPGSPPPISDDAVEVVPPNLVGYGAAPTSTQRPVRRPRVAEGTPPVQQSSPAEAPSVPAPRAERPRSTPPVRRLARERGIDLGTITGSGPDGLVLRSDVEAAGAPAVHTPDVAANSPERQDRAAPQGRTERRTPIRGVRKVTAEAMVRSAFTAPHVTTFHTVDVTETMAFIQRLREDRELGSDRIGLLAVVAKAVCGALGRQPALNSRWDEDAAEIVEPGGVRLGIAAATPRGLMVPNIADADLLSLVELNREIRDLTDTARAGKTTPAQMTGGTFTITNIGTFGIEAGTPILNPGEAGILATGAVVRRPWEFDGGIALRQVMTLSLSFDHRLVDGEQGARFLVDVANMLHDPARAMLWS